MYLIYFLPLHDGDVLRLILIFYDYLRSGAVFAANQPPRSLRPLRLLRLTLHLVNAF